MAKRVEALPLGAVNPTATDLQAAMARGCDILLALQEAAGPGQEPRAQWPYEGVYRVNRQIPVAYRIGGTAIAALALVDTPGYADNPERQAAVARATAFICAGIAEPLMSVDDYDAGYDVRGWGYTYGVLVLTRLKTGKMIPAGQEDALEKAMAFYLDGIERTQIPQTGGWNYARPAGRDKPAAPSSFMTAATLQALFAAKAAGYDVSAGTITKAMDFLERTRDAVGTVAYSGTPGRRSEGTPGAVGRMCIVEATLVMGGRGSLRDVRGAVDAFIAHWEWLDQRRQKGGTHEGPYAVAPYYFMFAHHYAAQCVQLLPRSERNEYNRRLNQHLFRVRGPDGGWNDRVFTRSAGYGTAMAMMAMGGPEVYPYNAEQPPGANVAPAANVPANVPAPATAPAEGR